MLSPEEYYDEFLKGKDETEIILTIMRLKREISHLKDSVERRSIAKIFPIDQIELEKIERHRLYIQRAYDVLEQKGVNYQFTKEEVFNHEFQTNIHLINKIEFVIGGFFEGYNRYEATIQDGKLNFNFTSTRPKIISWSIHNQRESSLESFFHQIYKLYMGEWVREYSASYYGLDIVDGVSWEVLIHYSNPLKEVEFSGVNSFPYNFSDFLKLFGIYNEELDVDKYV